MCSGTSITLPGGVPQVRVLQVDANLGHQPFYQSQLKSVSPTLSQNQGKDGAPSIPVVVTKADPSPASGLVMTNPESATLLSATTAPRSPF